MLQEFQPLMVVVILGVIAYAIERFVPMNEVFQFVFRVMVVLIALFLLVRFLVGYL